MVHSPASRCLLYQVRSSHSYFIQGRGHKLESTGFDGSGNRSDGGDAGVAAASAEPSQANASKDKCMVRMRDTMVGTMIRNVTRAGQ